MGLTRNGLAGLGRVCGIQYRVVDKKVWGTPRKDKVRKKMRLESHIDPETGASVQCIKEIRRRRHELSEDGGGKR